MRGGRRYARQDQPNPLGVSASSKFVKQRRRRFKTGARIMPLTGHQLGFGMQDFGKIRPVVVGFRDTARIAQIGRRLFVVAFAHGYTGKRQFVGDDFEVESEFSMDTQGPLKHAFMRTPDKRGLDRLSLLARRGSNTKYLVYGDRIGFAFDFDRIVRLKIEPASYQIVSIFADKYLSVACQRL